MRCNRTPSRPASARGMLAWTGRVGVKVMRESRIRGVRSAISLRPLGHRPWCREIMVQVE
eukprot:3636919-Rhodomonas_salina.2